MRRSVLRVTEGPCPLRIDAGVLLSCEIFTPSYSVEEDSALSLSTGRV
jgi:hypothetical protein